MHFCIVYTSYWLLVGGFAVNITFADKRSLFSQSRRKTWIFGSPKFQWKTLIKVLLRFLRLQGAQDL